jgi:hypothetical protein
VAKTRFVKNKKGETISVVLDIREYQRLMDDLEELDDIRAYDEAKKSGDVAVPFAQIAKRIRTVQK